MNHLSDTSYHQLHDVRNHQHVQQLEQQLIVLNNWKNKAKVQLSYFHAACRLYNFCDFQEVSELLND
ncbi:MAG: hypothetical protein WKF89_19350 [Chitinophagaceae bacterium]